jgi:N-acetylglucosaminyl-diphospho-decaprenol L-rhamnosyltransferase
VILTIAIVSFNAREDLARCLTSLTAAPPDCSHEVVVVDNASSDGAPDMVRMRFPQARLVCAPGNVGFSAANNIAFRESRSELVLLLNPDTIVPAGAIDTLVAELRSNPAAAAVGPRLVNADGRAELSFGRMPSPWNEAWQRWLGRSQQRGSWPVHPWVEARTRRGRRVAWVSGACLLVRRADAVAVGLLDERFFLYWEDVDFCAALRAAGRHVRFTPAAEVIHLRGRSTVAVGTATALAYRRGQLAFYRKWRPGWAPFLAWYLRVRGQNPDLHPDLLRETPRTDG